MATKKKLLPTYGIPQNFENRDKAIGYCTRLSVYGVICNYDEKMRKIVLAFPGDENDYRARLQHPYVADYKKVKAAFDGAVADIITDPKCEAMEHILRAMTAAFVVKDTKTAEKNPNYKKIQNSSLSGAKVSPSSLLYNQPASETMTAKTRATAAKKTTTTAAKTAAKKAAPKTIDASKSPAWKRLTSVPSLTSHLIEQFGITWVHTDATMTFSPLDPSFGSDAMHKGGAYGYQVAKAVTSEYNLELIAQNAETTTMEGKRRALMGLVNKLHGVVEHNHLQIEKIMALGVEDAAAALRNYGLAVDIVKTDTPHEPMKKVDIATRFGEDVDIWIGLREPGYVAENAKIFVDYGILQQYVSYGACRDSGTGRDYTGLELVHHLLCLLAPVRRREETSWREEMREKQKKIDFDRRYSFIDSCGLMFTDPKDLTTVRLPSPASFRSNCNWADVHLALVEAEQSHDRSDSVSAQTFVHTLVENLTKIVSRQYRQAISKERAVELEGKTAAKMREFLRSYGISVNVTARDENYHVEDAINFRHPDRASFMDAFFTDPAEIGLIPYAHRDVENAFSSAVALQAKDSNTSLRDCLAWYLSKLKRVEPKILAKEVETDPKAEATSITEQVAPGREEVEKTKEEALDATFIANGGDKDELNERLRAYGFKVDKAGNKHLVRLCGQPAYHQLYLEKNGFSYLDASRALSSTAQGATNGTITEDQFRADLVERLDKLAEIRPLGKKMEVNVEQADKAVQELRQAFAEKVVPQPLMDEAEADGRLRRLGVMILAHDNGDQFLELSPVASGRTRGALAALRSICNLRDSDPVDLVFKRALVRVAQPDNLQDRAKEVIEQERSNTEKMEFAKTAAEYIITTETAITPDGRLVGMNWTTPINLDERVKVNGDVNVVPGPPGARGDQGLPGKSAYEIAVDHGFVGTEKEWLASLKGEKVTEAQVIKSELEQLIEHTRERVMKQSKESYEYCKAMLEKYRETHGVGGTQFSSTLAMLENLNNIVEFARRLDDKRTAIPESQLGTIYKSLPAASKEKEHFSNAYILRYFLHNLPEVHLLNPEQLPEDVQKLVDDTRNVFLRDLGESIACVKVCAIREGEQLHLQAVPIVGDFAMSEEDIELTGGRNILGATRLRQDKK